MVHMLTIKDLETRPDGTYYTGPLEEAKAFIADWINSTEARYRDRTGKLRYAVYLTLEVGDGKPASNDNCNDIGVGDTNEEAWRYALGAEFGPADDNFSAFPLTHNQREAVEAMVQHHFPERLDAFYSPTTGLAAVEDTDGNMWRVWPDGNIEVYRR
jgi:hypothetical protein